MHHDRYEKQREAKRLEAPVELARELALKLGLDPYPVNYWVVDHDEMNQLIAYDGFQRRYPHWRWGMQYDRQRKKDRMGMGKAFEIVNNDDPSNAFLQESNTLADQKAVITHVEAHADFFRNNEWFGLFREDSEVTENAAGDGGAPAGGGTPVDDAGTRTVGDTDPANRAGPDAAAMLARHGERIATIMDDPSVDRADVERFIDAVLCLTDTIDQHTPFAVDAVQGEHDVDDLEARLDDLDVSEEVRRQVFDEEWLAERAAADAERPENPREDVLAFIRDHGRTYDDEEGKAVDREPWQEEVLEILRREAYYFAPQKMTKVMNEGWACVAPDTPVFTSDGLVPMEDVVDTHVSVSDGNSERTVYDSNIIPDHNTVTVETRRGFELTGSNNHRLRRPDGSWIRLDQIEEGDEIEVIGGNGIWANDYAPVGWDNPEYVTLNDVADEADVSVWTVMRYRKVGRAEKSEDIERALTKYEGENQKIAQRQLIHVPEKVDEKFGRFLGLLVGDGHVPSNSRHIGFTASEKVRAEEFAGLTEELFGINPTVSEQDSRWRVHVYSENLKDLLINEFELPTGKSAAVKEVPDHIRRSPKLVVAAFLRGLFDADGYAGKQGAILSTKSEEMSKTVQLLLTNIGILSRRREQSDGCFHVHLTGESADIFSDEIGFGYTEKQQRLERYLDELSWFEEEKWTDEVVELSEGTGDVYDISVEETHRYAAAGFVNHNSKWESLMMADEGFAGDDEVFTYADHMSRVLGSPGFNPYAVGKELWEYVENTANRREVADKLLRVDGITPATFKQQVDFDEVLSLLAPDHVVDRITPETLADLDPDDPRVDADALARARDGEVDVAAYPWRVLTHEGLAERHYSLCKPQHRGFLRRIPRDELDELHRYMFDDAKYATVAEAVADVDHTAGWERMREVRESHNDVTFVDAFLTQEFVREHGYFAYEYSHAKDDYRVTSTDVADVRKKLLLRFTNFGKPTVAVYDGNFDNRGELLLGHQYNGVAMDIGQAKQVLERTFELWGRPVNLATIVKEVDSGGSATARPSDEEPDPEERGVRIRYDGESFSEQPLDADLQAELAADEVDYDTKPEDWLA